jgi:hypothetical protein
VVGVEVLAAEASLDVAAPAGRGVLDLFEVLMGEISHGAAVYAPAPAGSPVRLIRLDRRW